MDASLLTTGERVLDPPHAVRARLTAVVRILIICLVFWHARTVHYIEDDGFISFRYAQHLAHGQGLVYNIGERVEGYTNFLWVALLAGASRLMPSVEMSTLALTLGLAATGATMLLVLDLPLLGRRWQTEGLIAALLLATHAGFVAWSTAGVETALFASLLFAGAITVARHLQGGAGISWAPVWFALAALTRADGAFFFGVTLAVLLAIEVRRQGRAGIRLPLRLGAAFLAIYVPYLLWRHSYYGEWLPNTAFAKPRGDTMAIQRGLRYVQSYVQDYGVWLWMPVVLLYLSRTRDSWVWYFVALIAADLAFVIYIGGDSLGFHRFIVHVAPLMCVVVSCALVDMFRKDLLPVAGPRVGLLAAAILLTSIAGLSARSTLGPVFWPESHRWTETQSELSFPGDGLDHNYTWFANYFVVRLRVAAQYLQTHAPAGSVVAATPAGAIAYYLGDHTVIDMLGLTDKHIARTTELYQGEWRFRRAGHEKGDGRYVLSRAPDYILMGNVAVLPFPLTESTMAEKLEFKSEHEIWAEPEFHARYELVSVRLASSGPFQYFTFYRKRR